MAALRKRMAIKNIRQKLQDFIEGLDEKRARALYILFEDEMTDHFTKEEINLFNKRSAKRQQGNSQIYNWEEAMQIITKKKR
jgi:hypothetical protein